MSIFGSRNRKRVKAVDCLSSNPPSGNANDLRTKQELSSLPTLSVLGWTHSESISDIQMEFQMTIRTKITKLTPKQASMLLMMLVLESLYKGVDITTYLGLEFLRNVLVKNGHDFMETREEEIRKTVMLSELILTWIHGSWLNLSDREKVPDQVFENIQLTGWLPSDRTINSWKQYWNPQRFLEVRIVPLEQIIERTDSDSERYSGYTKGYGNDGSPASPQVEKYSYELDGTPSDREPPAIPLQDLQIYNEVLLSIEKAKAEKQRKK